MTEHEQWRSLNSQKGLIIPGNIDFYQKQLVVVPYVFSITGFF